MAYLFGVFGTLVKERSRTIKSGTGRFNLMLESDKQNTIVILELVKTVLRQNTTLIDNIIKHFEKGNLNKWSGLIYEALCQIEQFLLFLLYNTIKEVEFKKQVEEALTCVYHYRIKYSHFLIK